MPVVELGCGAGPCPSLPKSERNVQRRAGPRPLPDFCKPLREEYNKKNANESKNGNNKKTAMLSLSKHLSRGSNPY